MNICICGGGNVGHVIAGYLSINKNVSKVSILSTQPNLWQPEIIISTPENENLQCKLYKISNNPKEVIPNADIIIICLPSYAIEETIINIKSSIKKDALVGSIVSSGGFFWIAKYHLGDTVKLFGFQRVPFISRIIEYGKHAELKGFKKEIQIAITNTINKDKITSLFSDLFSTPCKVLNHYLEATLTNSNPILHTSRLYSLFHDWTPEKFYTIPPLFYEEWDNLSSEVLIKCDNEFMNIISCIPVNNLKIQSILEYYESTDALSLTNKLKSISAFKGIQTQMKQTKNRYIPDFTYRYFTEDIDYGLIIIKYIASLLNLATPTIDKILTWSEKCMNKSFLINGQLKGKDILITGIPSKFGIKNINDLITLLD